MKRLLAVLAAAMLAAVVLSAQSTPASRASGSRLTGPPSAAVRSVFSPERLACVQPFLQQYVDENRIAGAVALVLRDGQPVYEGAVGWSDKEAGRRMAPDQHIV